MRNSESTTSQPVARRLAALAVIALVMNLSMSVRPSYAQADRGTIQGQVTDQSEGVVPHAKVEITHIATGTITTVMSNSEGSFTVPNLPVGEYRV